MDQVENAPLLTVQDEVAILLAEYTSLRNELQQRNTVLNQTYATGAAVMAGALGLLGTPLWQAGLVLIIVLPLPLVFFTLMLRYDVEDAAGRVREIENAINQLAGKRLLVWETDHGLKAVSYVDRIKTVLRGRSD
jgi:hypothetical protein